MATQPIYAWKPADAHIHRWIVAQRDPDLIRAWRLVRAIIHAQGVLYARSRPEVALARAWEDFDIACRGMGEAAITGAVFHLWCEVPPELEATLETVLGEAFRRAQDATPPRALRYAASTYRVPIATHANRGFRRRAALPREQVLADGVVLFPMVRDEM